MPGSWVTKSQDTAERVSNKCTGHSLGGRFGNFHGKKQIAVTKGPDDGTGSIAGNSRMLVVTQEGCRKGVLKPTLWTCTCARDQSAVSGWWCRDSPAHFPGTADADKSGSVVPPLSAFSTVGLIIRKIHNPVHFTRVSQTFPGKSPTSGINNLNFALITAVSGGYNNPLLLPLFELARRSLLPTSCRSSTPIKIHDVSSMQVSDCSCQFPQFKDFHSA